MSIARSQAIESESKKELKQDLEDKIISTYQKFWSRDLDDIAQSFLAKDPLAVCHLNLRQNAKQPKDLQAAKKIRAQLETELKTDAKSEQKPDLCQNENLIRKYILLGILYIWDDQIEKAIHCFDLTKKFDSEALYQLTCINIIKQIKAHGYRKSFLDSSPDAMKQLKENLQNLEHDDNINAAFKLGLEYAREARYLNQAYNKSTKEEYSKLAIYYLTSTATRNHPEAAYHLALEFTPLDGSLASNVHKRLKYIRQAISGGDPNALYTLAELYLRGIDVPHNLELAFKLFDLACDNLPNKISLTGFHQFCNLPLSIFFKNVETKGDYDSIEDLEARVNFYPEQEFEIISEKLTKLEEEKAQQGNEFCDKKHMVLALLYIKYNSIKTFECLEILAQKNNEISQAAKEYLAFLYHYGYGKLVPPNHRRALKYYESIDPNYPCRYMGYGDLYRSGLSELFIKPDLVTATSHYQTMIDKGCRSSYYRKGQALSARGMQTEAFTAYKESLNGGYCRYALIDLANQYKSENDLYQAFRLYYQSANVGNVDAQYEIGTMYYHGNGIVKDYRLAFKFFNIAAKKGHINSIWYIALMYRLGVGIQKDEGKAAYYYRKLILLRRSGQKELEDILNDIFDKTNSSNPEVIYHAALGISAPNHNLRVAFIDLAEKNPKIFDKLLDFDPWHKVQALLPENVAKAVYERRRNYLALKHYTLQKRGFPLPIVDEILSFQVAGFKQKLVQEEKASSHSENSMPKSDLQLTLAEAVKAKTYSFKK